MSLADITESWRDHKPEFAIALAVLIVLAASTAAMLGLLPVSL